MLAINTTYITDHQGKTISAVVPINDFKKMIEIIEDYENLKDLQLYEEAKKDKAPAEPMEIVFDRIEKKAQCRRLISPNIRF